MTYSKEKNNYSFLFQGALFSVPVFNDSSVKYHSQLITFKPFVVSPRCLKRKREEQEKAEEALKCMLMFQQKDCTIEEVLVLLFRHLQSSSHIFKITEAKNVSNMLLDSVLF